ncbi:hypothetical protein D9758_013013 [Tetrapyrgos nigripes]|uniref:Phosphatidate phosphatase APP1 catalytic domain-containing protein n=1 Tax=Tetrapyrgos nigripes TaxID=182062 RepID=A0A8H5C9Y3_9AGAR|nr:hypothetical protein D9758_013013 [Tetrapyrgos nigripes]
MQFAGLALTVILSLSPIYATPLLTTSSTLSKRIPVTDCLDVLVFDSPGFQNASDASQTIASVEAFAFLKDLDTDELRQSTVNALNSIGFNPGEDAIDTAVDRLKLFAAVGVPRVTVTVEAEGCSETPKLTATALEDLGETTSLASFGTCAAPATNGGAEITLTVNGSDFSSARIFPSGPDGFGVISDIDDTVKISHSLDTLQLVQATLFDEPAPIPGMPEVYASLARSLNSPQFIYVSGSPYQLYPFLRDFIDTTFSASNGPLFLTNVTVTDLNVLFQTLTADDGNATLVYKIGQLTRIHEMYPGKSFLTVGDSTQQDPETYATIYNTFGGDFVRCIWIHLVEGADNSDERFKTAFEGVPQERIRLYTDDQIPELAYVDVAGGQC